MEVLQRTANRGSISTGYDIDNSLKMEADNSESIARTPSSAGNRKTWTLSFWFKRTELGAAVRLFEAWDGSTGTSALFTDDDLFILDLNTASNYFTSSQVFRDTSAWYHFVVRVDTTSATASERARVYVNGSELAGSWTGGYIGQNTDLTWNQDVVHYFGVFHTTSNFANGYYAEVINVDGTSLAPTEFGKVDSASGIWIPIDASPTYGTNGFYLDFESSGSLGADSSGNGHTWTLNNITSADQATDTPTNNFATLNPLWVWTYGMGISDGATKVANTVTAWGGAKGSIGVTNGKWYWEHSSFSGNDTFFGIQNSSGTAAQAYEQAYTVGLFANATSDIYFYDPSGRTESFSFTFATSDVWGIALDLDGNTISFYRNGSIVNSAVALDGIVGNGELFPFVSHYGSGLNSRINLGGYTGSTISSAASDENGYGTFEYAPPSGYYALCTKNLAEFG
jgi:hypothetical protein